MRLHSVGAALSAYVGGTSDPITGNNVANGQVTDDDVALVWLNDQSQREAVKAVLTASTACLAVDPATKTVSAVLPLICADNGGAVFDLGTQPRKFGDPADGRTPDFMVQPNPGVIYTKSQAKDMEHRGFAADDGHVALLVSLPSMAQKTVTRHVKTTQVAPTVVIALGLEPRLLQSVRKEGTHVLPHAISDEDEED